MYLKSAVTLLFKLNPFLGLLNEVLLAEVAEKLLEIKVRCKKREKSGTLA